MSPERSRKPSVSACAVPPGSRFIQFGESSVSESQRSCQRWPTRPALEQDVLVAGAGQVVAQGEPGLAGADDQGVDAWRHAACLALSRVPRRAPSRRS